MLQNQSLLDLLGESRRADLHILNIPEGSEDGKDQLKIMSEVLMQAMGLNMFLVPPELERAH